jgi:hypothetical protein
LPALFTAKRTPLFDELTQLVHLVLGKVRLAAVGGIGADQRVLLLQPLDATFRRGPALELCVTWAGYQVRHGFTGG